MGFLYWLLLAPPVFAQMQARTAPSPVPVSAAVPFLPASAPGLPSLPSLSLPALPGLPALAAPAARGQAEPRLAAPAAALRGTPELRLRSVGALRSLSPALRGGPALKGAALDSAHRRSAARFDGSLLGGAAPVAGLHAEDPLSRPERPAGALHKLHPRVAILVDVFPTRLPDDLVRYVDTLQQEGVQVVFLTHRPERGPGSVEHVLTSRLTPRRTAPVVVASFNGGRIYAHAGRAQNPRSLVADGPSFSPKEVQRLVRIANRTAADLNVRKPAVRTFPEAAALEFRGSLSRRTDPARFVSTLNSKLRQAGLPFRAETAGSGFSIRPTALHLALPRLWSALESVTGKDALERPGEILLIADPKRHEELVQAMPKGVSIAAADGTASAREVLRSVLGSKSLHRVSVERNKMRSYVEWIARKEEDESFRSGGGGGGGGGRGSDGVFRQLAFYKGVIIYELMARLYRDIRNGQYHLASPVEAEQRLKSMWRNPRKNFVRVPKEIQGAMEQGSWQAHQRGALESAVGWLRNYYARHFPDYPNGLTSNVIQRVTNISSDGKSLITLELRSPYTDRLYRVHVRPARVELHRDMDGQVLLASAYRTGREKPGLFDEVEAKILAQALLTGYAKKEGEGWTLNGRPVHELRVSFDYNTRTVDYAFKPSQGREIETELASMIERMESDAAFKRHYEEQKAKAASEIPGAKKRAKKPAARRTARRR